jgi:chromosome segregation and condensation protein ScpB
MSAREIEALLFLSPEPVPVEELADALQTSEEAVRDGLAELAEALDGRGVACSPARGPPP